MEITYQRANPHGGNESFLLRVRRKHEPRTPCILVDAGDSVEIGELLDDNDYLAAILLTHAHVDHYGSLDDAYRDGTPILTSPGTAAILEDVFAEGKRHYGLSDTDTLLEEVEGIDCWRDIGDGIVRVHPVPAGHAPGACGFLLQVGKEDQFRALVTGDFTRRDAAGYPGFDPEAYFGIDAVFLTAATNKNFEDNLTDTIGTLVQRANEGSTTLCTASGLTGVHLATLLAGVDRELDRSVHVILAGQVAKLYESLGYDHANVETIPTYADPRTCFEAGGVTIAGPEVPVEGSSARLFGAIRDDPNATLVQVRGGNTDAKDRGDARGTVSSTTFTNHPSEDVLDDIVETISPAHIVVGHQHGRANDRYKDKWDVYTWANSDSSEQTLFRDGAIVPPPWVGERTHSRVRNDRSQTVLASNTDLLGEISLPEIGRKGQLDLESEGIDLSRLRKRLRTGQPAPSTTSRPAGTTQAGGATGRTRQVPVADGGLYETTGPQLEEVEGVPFTTDTTDQYASGGLVDTISYSVRKTSQASQADGLTDTAADGDTDGTGSVNEKTDAEQEVDNGKDREVAAPDQEGSGETIEMSRSIEGDKDQPADGVDPAEKVGETDVQSSDTMSNEGPESTIIEVDPVVRSLAVELADETGETIDTLVAYAVEELLTAILRGDEVHLVPDAPTITVDADPALERAIDQSMPDDCDVSAFVRRTLCEGLDIDPDERTLSVGGVDALTPLVEAIAENDEFPVTDRDQIVQVALERHVLDR